MPGLVNPTVIASNKKKKKKNKFSKLYDLKQNYINENNKINEDGEAAATNANTGGLGSVTGASPSTNIECTTGTNYTAGGGTVGSGDIGFPFNGNSKKKKKKLSQISKNYTGQKPTKMKKFDDFIANNESHEEKYEVIGLTSSGKKIYNIYDHPSHNDFSAIDCADAGTLAKKLGLVKLAHDFCWKRYENKAK